MELYKPLLHQTTFWCFHYWQCKRLIRRRKTLLNVNHSKLKKQCKTTRKITKVEKAHDHCSMLFKCTAVSKTSHICW